MIIYWPTLQLEIRLHRKIDLYTDSHSAVLATRQHSPGASYQRSLRQRTSR
ncbi:hypothetical protein QWZ03_10400 [Chitinimonas viridis]|uniref:Uncharacterized protein n=1 Tax=Chitinimonas viridis TaxID=664880 RepID=A0ABT8B4J9_9NEIS|nr:hypothetical protein [Chitinimonas viridis]MDN3577177.1 hypothetical protein [Chitinimonas viridis]